MQSILAECAQPDGAIKRLHGQNLDREHQQRSHDAQKKRPKSSVNDVKTGAQSKPGEQTRGDASLGRASLSSLSHYY